MDRSVCHTNISEHTAHPHPHTYSISREIRDCRALQPHALRIYGAELAPPNPNPSNAPPDPMPGTGERGKEKEEGHGSAAGAAAAAAGGPPVLRLYGFSKLRCVLRLRFVYVFPGGVNGVMVVMPPPPTTQTGLVSLQ